MKNYFLKLVMFLSIFAALFMGVSSCEGEAKLVPNKGTPGGGGKTETGFKRDTIISNYVEYRSGNLPLIISVPHDGDKTNSAYTLRTKENCPDPSFETVKDSYTTELASLIDSVVHARTGKYAHLVRCEIRRTYVDMNRERRYAVPNDSKQTEVYDTYHNRMKSAKSLVTILLGKGLVVDIHAHGHTIQQVELGYLLSKANLNKSDNDIMLGNLSKESSIYSLSKSNKQNKSFVELLRGSGSFGNLLVERNVPCVPNSTKPSPEVESYFDGGYITQTYGSVLAVGGTVDAIQMEFDSTARSAERRREYAKNVADALLKFLELYY